MTIILLQIDRLLYRKLNNNKFFGDFEVMMLHNLRAVLGIFFFAESFAKSLSVREYMSFSIFRSRSHVYALPDSN